MQQRRRRQIVVSTHSTELLSDKSIGAEEVLLLDPSPEGTTIRRASDSGEVPALLEGGFSVGEATLPRTAPEHASQLRLFRMPDPIPVNLVVENPLSEYTSR